MTFGITSSQSGSIMPDASTIPSGLTDVAGALQVRALHVHLGGEVGQLDHHRIGERRLAQRERPETPLHGSHRDAHGDLVAERLERNDLHLVGEQPAQGPVGLGERFLEVLHLAAEPEPQE